MAKPSPKDRPFPSKQAVLDFIRDNPDSSDRKEIARAFHLRRADQPALKALLRELAAEGLIGRDTRRRFNTAERLPKVQVLEVAGSNADGELLARPAGWPAETTPPTIYLAPERRGRPALTAGDRVLARLSPIEESVYEARIIRVLGAAPRQVLGVYDPDAEGGRLRPTDRRAKRDYILRRADAAGAEKGELLLAELKPQERAGLGLRPVRVVERLGRLGEAKTLSLISIHEHDIPSAFPPKALAEAEAAGPLVVAEEADGRAGAREELRALPLVTIDGADARDFDDAVFAEPDSDPANAGGWHLIVAIADVAHYVRSGSPLDRAAYERGNSVYFPDRVVPMLPEALSNGWCSLKPGEDRPCLAAHLWIDAEGRLRRHRFTRAVMRSAARLTYEDVQAARDGEAPAALEPLLGKVIEPLYGAYRALAQARDARGVLDLDLPERKVCFDAKGAVAAVAPVARLDSHRLIEEFMITANVAAAETLERLRQPCMYRIHDAPDPIKLEALRQVLRSLDLSFARGQVVRPRVFAQLLDKVAGRPEAPMISELVLRAQSRAAYAPRNIGHFGLALTHYAHFTSPIRRYPDLLVHRALITGLGLGGDGLGPGDAERFEEAGRHLSDTERRAQAAERDAMDRFVAAFLQDRIGAAFRGRVTGVTRFGLFVSLDDTGADGLVPISSLPEDFYDHVEAAHCLLGRRWGRCYRLGERLTVELTEADPLTGGLVMRLREPDREPDAEADHLRPPRRGRQRGGPRRPASSRGQRRSRNR